MVQHTIRQLWYRRQDWLAKKRPFLLFNVCIWCSVHSCYVGWRRTSRAMKKHKMIADGKDFKGKSGGVKGLSNELMQLPARKILSYSKGPTADTTSHRCSRGLTSGGRGCTAVHIWCCGCKWKGSHKTTTHSLWICREFGHNHTACLTLEN